MIFHVSIEAPHPKRLAEGVATLWQGAAAPLDRLVEGAWIAFSANGEAALEVFPLGTDITEASGYQPWTGPRHAGDRPTATHVAMGTPLAEHDVLEIARQEGWRAKSVMRGERFGVIEVWVSEHLVMEWLTPDMQKRYMGTVSHMLNHEVVRKDAA